MKDYDGCWGDGYILRCDNCDSHEDTLYRVSGEDLCFNCMLDEWAREFTAEHEDEFLEWLDAEKVEVEEEED